MKIAKEGYPIIAIPALLTIIALLLGWNWAAALFVIVTLAVAAFFRDPERIPPLGSDLILAPADGKVVEIRRVEEAAGDASARLSIFMSPLDVHVNRAPVSGTVQKIEYQKGCFMPAYKEDCSENNERNALTLVGSDGLPVKLVQIAGIMARRIICRAKPGDTLEAGERFGIIMFGSRVDVYIPTGAEIVVGEGVHVTGGESVLARKSI
ncbi:MAG TPA: phosphatidylserine decarboxylase family protein [Candidatus Binatia bacterium]|jgi:phosphatidylserine decarboxylase